VSSWEKKPTKKARKAYGPDATGVTKDLSPSELQIAQD
jgi:hypothetical protein